MTAVALLLQPKWLTARARSRAGRPGRWVALGLVGAGFWWGVFAVLARLLRYFRNVDPDLGPVLAAKLLGMVLGGFFAILLLSNVITALSSFFLARDLDLLAAAPVRWPALYAAKLVETIVSSSWMVALMAVPLVAAYGVIYGGGVAFPLLALAALVPFFVLPAVAGAALTLLLVNAFPARRTRDILSVVAVLSGAGLVALFRLLRPERLARPEGFQSFTSYLVALQSPTAPWLPSEWAQQAVMGWLTHHPAMRPFLLLWGATLGALALGALLHRSLYTRGFSQAQEGAGQSTDPRRAGRRGIMSAGLAPLGTTRRELVLKELRVFFRDTTQWSQLLLLAVLIVVYVFNVKFLPLTGEGVSFFLRNVVPFCNLLLAGFVLASIAARFIFPGVSLEGRTFWLLRSSPLALHDLLWAKYWVGTLPLLILALAIVSVTNSLLEVSEFIFAVTVLSIALLTFAVSALALCFGTLFPQFETENAAQIPTSFGGLIYMMTAVALLGVVIILEARPVYLYLAHHFYGRYSEGPDLRSLVLGFGTAGALCVAATLIPIRIALKKLDAVERG
jgi:ABC-2 type transport system permease protein